MALFTKQKNKLQLLLTNSDQATAHGGQLVVDALCRRFNLWQRLQAESALDPRKRKGAGYTPSALVAQLLFTLTSGGASLADAERLGQDVVLMQLLGLTQGADQTTLGEWLRAQTEASVLALHQLNASSLRQLHGEQVGQAGVEFLDVRDIRPDREAADGQTDGNSLTDGAVPGIGVSGSANRVPKQNIHKRNDHEHSCRGK